MRREPTEPEKRLWRHLSGSQLAGYKFRRQAVIGTAIADFLCPQKALIVEVDGDTHVDGSDTARDAKLIALGYRIVRVTNHDVMTNIEGVLSHIANALEATPARWDRPHPNPSPEGDGLRKRGLPPSPSGEGPGVGPVDNGSTFPTAKQPSCQSSTHTENGNHAPNQ